MISHSDLLKEYRDGDQADQDLFAEQRTNIQLVAGDHYNRLGSRYWNRIRESRNIPNDIKLRLTKNHTSKIVKIYRNAITSHAPGVVAMAKNEKEIQDQKSAELAQKVWDHIKQEVDFDCLKREWAKDFVETGEIGTEVLWDMDAGFQVGWEQATDEAGQPLSDEQGNPLQSDRPIMSGGLYVNTAKGFNVIRQVTAQSPRENERWTVRKMEKMSEMKKRYEGDEQKQELFKESSEMAYRVFDTHRGTYGETKGMSVVLSTYQKKCIEYPSGYFWMYTEHGRFEEGELPFGIYPFIFTTFDEITSSPRGYSVIRHLRPYQIEINRAASKIAEHQVTLGDDKVWFSSASRPNKGATRSGIRENTYVGDKPTIVPGRSGSQYVDYMNGQIDEMYDVADVKEEREEIRGDVEPYTLLFRSMRQKKKFSMYSEKFESHLVKFAQLCIEYYKRYAPDELLIEIFGPHETGNIAEFRNQDDSRFHFKLEPQVEDIETKMGKQIMVDKALQYVGSQLGKEDIGKFLRLSPYLNQEQMFDDMTLEYDNATNDILAMDRGEPREVHKHDDHDYHIKRLVNRMKQSDFEFKDPFIKQLYEKKVNDHYAAKISAMEDIALAQKGLIPSGGYMVSCDFYVPSGEQGEKQKRLRISSEALEWLLDRLRKQGSLMRKMESLPVGAKQDLSNLFLRTNSARDLDGVVGDPPGTPQLPPGPMPYKPPPG